MTEPKQEDLKQDVTTINEQNEESSKPAEDKAESIYYQPLKNQVNVARNHPLNYYVDRCRRILRKDETMKVKGRDSTIANACTVVEMLKRQKIASIKRISTAMDTQAFFGVYGEPRWAKPAPVITFELERGEFATCVSDYHQRKVIEIFERTEETRKSGLISYDQIKKLDFGTAFKANEDQVMEAKKFLDSAQSQENPETLDLPDFIRYSSILIHPLLNDRVFKAALKDHFGINDDRNKNAHMQDENDDDTHYVD